ncbi:hypothetical protein [Roseibium litorale]|uniref:Lipoprotein n=1 Tax=Roseibium litorale TaxID=2803841 RepID=A0ABR9CQY9_9HYPH|nr:hypothetical protein [Roseibium litorale]MBD8893242.1 hypothetical protein [Roseibium litorale]
MRHSSNVLQVEPITVAVVIVLLVSTLSFCSKQDTIKASISYKENVVQKKENEFSFDIGEGCRSVDLSHKYSIKEEAQIEFSSSPFFDLDQDILTQVKKKIFEDIRKQEKLSTTKEIEYSAIARMDCSEKRICYWITDYKVGDIMFYTSDKRSSATFDFPVRTELKCEKSTT